MLLWRATKMVDDGSGERPELVAFEKRSAPVLECCKSHRHPR
jgi:hypothetical protein